MPDNPGHDALHLGHVLRDIDDVAPVSRRQRIITRVQPCSHQCQRHQDGGLSYALLSGNDDDAGLHEARDHHLGRRRLAVKFHEAREGVRLVLLGHVGAIAQRQHELGGGLHQVADSFDAHAAHLATSLMSWPRVGAATT